MRLAQRREPFELEDLVVLRAEERLARGVSKDANPRPASNGGPSREADISEFLNRMGAGRQAKVTSASGVIKQIDRLVDGHLVRGAIGQRIAILRQQRKDALAPKHVDVSGPRYFGMDVIDRKILTVLQQDASLSVAEVGNRVGLSSTPCWKRIQKLEAEGVIQKRVAVVDPDPVGLGVSVFVAIETGDHSEEWLARLPKQCVRCLR